MGPDGYCAADGNVGLCGFEGFSTVCINIMTDSQNCGALGQRCPTGQTCASGACSGDVAPCGAGRNGAYCDIGPAGAGTSELCCAGGACTDVLTDVVNCGTCGNACSANLACVNGRCEALSCVGQPNGAPCGAGAKNECCGGSCVDAQTDATNCGSCTTQCAGAETCLGGLCGFDACTAVEQGDPCHLPQPTFHTGDCCGTACVDETSDSANCGGCNLPCAGGTKCTNGACR